MAHDEGLAERIRELLDERDDVAEMKMFGGVAFMIRSHMAVGIIRDDLMVRVGPEAYEELLRQPHARPMDFNGKPMKGYLYIAPGGLNGMKISSVGSGVGCSMRCPSQPSPRRDAVTPP